MALTKAKASNILLTTPAANSNDVTPATTEYVTTAINNLIDGAPATLNTLDEIAAALNDDAALNTTLTNAIAAKLPLAGGTLTGALTGTSATFTGGLALTTASGTGGQYLSLDNTDTGGRHYALISTNNAHGSLGGGDFAILDLDVSGNDAARTRFLIDSSGNVGIGTSSPQRELHVQNSSSGATSTGNSVAVFEGNDNTEVSILGGSSSVLSLNFGHSGDNNEGLLYFNTTNGSENMQLQSSKHITIRAGADNVANNIYFKAYNTDVMTIDGSNNRVGIGTTGPSEELHVNSDVSGQHTRVHVTKTGTAGTAGISFNTTSSSNTWTLFQEDASASKFYFYDGADYVMTLDSANKVAIGDTTTPATKLHIAGAQNDVHGQLYIYGSGSNQDPQIAMGSSTNGRGFYLDDNDVNRFKIYTGHGKGASSGAYEFVLDNSGTIESKRTYANTTGAYSANVYVHTDGSFNRSTSSRRYKKNIVDATKGLDEILQLKPRNYKPKNDRIDSSEPNAEVNDPHLDAEERTFAGLIAEEVHDLGLTEYVDYEEDGTTPSGLYYGNMVALLVKGIQEQQTIIEDLKARIEALES